MDLDVAPPELVADQPIELLLGRHVVRELLRPGLGRAPIRPDATVNDAPRRVTSQNFAWLPWMNSNLRTSSSHGRGPRFTPARSARM